MRGSHWIGKKNPDYWDKGKPYLDGFRAIFIPSASAQVAAVRGERAMIQFRGFTPADRDSLVAALGNKITVQESPWNCSIGITPNEQKKPYDDKRVRRALTLALDRHEGSKALSKIALIKEVAGIQVPGTPWATPPAELEKLAGYGRDINAARAEARRLLKEAGAENLSFTLLNRAVPQPYEPFGIWVIDQWRQIGITVKHNPVETSSWFGALRSGDFEVAVTAPCNSIVEPDMDIHWFLSTSPVNYGKHKDTVMDDLYSRQSRTLDNEERRRAPAAVREAPLRRGGALHHGLPVAPHHPPQLQGAGLDDHAEPLPQPDARHRLAQPSSRVAAVPPFRADHVGSLASPGAARRARRQRPAASPPPN